MVATASTEALHSSTNHPGSQRENLDPVIYPTQHKPNNQIYNLNSLFALTQHGEMNWRCIQGNSLSLRYSGWIRGRGETVVEGYALGGVTMRGGRVKERIHGGPEGRGGEMLGGEMLGGEMWARDGGKEI
ncbi:hypothetical protein Pcinc_022970 [Petrolisthes cinctipes]|uniref:Uncharacterized protein n=1 Tax=Petrolisthes cinctipes TaxID=88211 RepID=A0AAE1FDP9_PETCI|nr:hypothetical protein Pcinc_022970 [Petrolisthes cinctipes]